MKAVDLEEDKGHSGATTLRSSELSECTRSTELTGLIELTGLAELAELTESTKSSELTFLTELTGLYFKKQMLAIFSALSGTKFQPKYNNCFYAASLE